MADRPNIIMLVAEDAGRALGCYGDADARTPNLDRLAGEGCRYDNAFSTAPVCAPSRCTMVTGQYAWSIGAHHMRSTLLHPPRLCTHELRDAGYCVNWHTKTDFNFDPAADFADSTAPWLEDLRRGALPERPFFLFRNFSITHESTMWAQPWDGGGAVKERLANEHLLKPEQRADPSQVRVPAYLPDRPEVRRDIARFYGALAMMDAQVGEVLAALDESKYRDNTIVVYLTDHGRGLPREKRWCYGAGVHLSLVVRWPDVIRPGRVSDELVSWVDLAPTLCALAGIGVPERFQGQVFLGPGAAPPRQFVFAGRDRMDEAFDRVRVVRDRRFHYIRNFFPQLPYAQRNSYMERMETMQVLRELNARGELHGPALLWMSPTKPAEELYDAAADPDMVRNLAGDPAHAGTLERMRAALDEVIKRRGDYGELPERRLIERGIVANRLDTEYAKRIKPLPPEQQFGGFSVRLEMPAEGRAVIDPA
jgi:N-sulfoglucosamine sulfohydrolase